jgi:chorismate mutase
MQDSVRGGMAKLRDEIAEIKERIDCTCRAGRTKTRRSAGITNVGFREQEILDELMALADWGKL